MVRKCMKKEDRREEVRKREGNGKKLLHLIYHICKGQITKRKKGFSLCLAEAMPL